MASPPERPRGGAPAPLAPPASPGRRASALIERFLWAVAATAALWLLFISADRARFQGRMAERLDAESSNSTPARRELPFVGRLEIPGIELSRLVVDGVDDRTLRRAVGRVPSSALPGEPGNVVLAGHRDTDFRDLGRLRRGDDLYLSSSHGESRYRVDSIRIVEPDRVEVLAPLDRPTLTLITCYPFHYVGAAPLRYVVRAVEVSRLATPTPSTAATFASASSTHPDS